MTDSRIKQLEGLVLEAQRVLAMMISPDSIKSTSVLHAFAQATEVESKLRAALAANAPSCGRRGGNCQCTSIEECAIEFAHSEKKP